VFLLEKYHFRYIEKSVNREKGSEYLGAPPDLGGVSLHEIFFVGVLSVPPTKLPEAKPVNIALVLVRDIAATRSFRFQKF